ncbi:MAG: hypothetical protein IT160_01645 [Bryobacterales bacterium]|nr:hypothetical protein [Bryobacterales bacterium]
MITRRELLAALAAAPMAGACNPRGLETPYKLGRLIVSGSGHEGAFDRIAVDCPFVFYHHRRFWMTYLGFDGIGYQTGLASSNDLADWRSEGAILKRDPASPIARYNIALNWILRENDLGSRGRLRKVGGRYVGVYHAYPGAGFEVGPAVIGLAWSSNLRDWKVDEPCLRASDGAAWEKAGLYKPCLVEDSGTYYLFYNAKNLPTHWREQTGVATSRDLRSWTRYEANPILRNGPAGSPDERFASDPCVLRDGKRWVFFYFGLDSKGVARDLAATGPDPFHAEKCSQVLIDVGPPGSIDSTYAHKPSVITYEGVLYHFYCAVSKVNGKEVRGISVARSKPW